MELVYENKEEKENILKKTKPTSFEKIRTYGEEGVKKWLNRDDWNNMLIFGENLSVLKSLYEKRKIRGNVRLVYIDPPFATDREFRSGYGESVKQFSIYGAKAYSDKLVGDSFLSFLRKRLIFLREILADNGSIYVHIDWKMGHYLKVIMDEIFGEEHFINHIARIKCNPKNFERNAYGNIKDIILFYSKTDDYVWNNPQEKMSEEDIRRLFPKIDKNGRRYTTIPLHAPGETKDGPTGQPWKGIKPPKGRHWRSPPDELTKLDEQGLIEWSKTGNPRKIIYAEGDRIYRKCQDIWEFKDPAYPTYPTEKNLEMLKLIVRASSNPGDIVLDCFAGSGTTLVAAEELGRKWLGVDNSPLAIVKSLEKLGKIENCSSFTLYNATGKPLPETIQKVL